MRSIHPGILCLLCVCSFAATPAIAAGPRPDDAQLTDWIEEAIAADPRVPGDAVTVETRAGIVTLSGSVPTLAGRSYAVLDAQKIYGVLGVIDQLEIFAPVRVDVELEAAVRSRIANSAFIDSGELEVAVEKGVVRLSGEVRSDSERYEAGLLASEVAGVRGVENFLSAPSGAASNDQQIQKDVTSTLRRDVHLARLPIEVAVSAGTVTLSGPVESAYEKSLAESRTRWVNGVRAVSNQLQVEWWGDREAPISLPTPRTDEELAASTLAQLQQDGRVDADEIDVAVDRGRVILRGRVPSLRQRRVAEEDVWNVSGVGWVANELTVAAEPRTDAEILEAIRSAIALDSQLADVEITVQVEAGAVTLAGQVASRHQRAHAAAIAARTRGVERLENRLSVALSKQPADDEIAREVSSRLSREWRTAKLGDRIHIDVHGGVVTLTGTVEFWAERRSAGLSAAATGGVRMVRNRIVVLRYPYPWRERQPDAEPEGSPDWDPYYYDQPTLPWIAASDRRRERSCAPGSCRVQLRGMKTV